MKTVLKQKAQPCGLGNLYKTEFWLPELDSNQRPAD